MPEHLSEKGLENGALALYRISGFPAGAFEAEGTPRGLVIGQARACVTAYLAALDRNDLLALLRQSLPEDEVAVVLTREETGALIAAVSAREAGSSHGPGTILDGRCAACAARSKLQALLSNPEPEEKK